MDPCHLLRVPAGSPGYVYTPTLYSLALETSHFPFLSNDLECSFHAEIENKWRSTASKISLNEAGRAHRPGSLWRPSPACDLNLLRTKRM